MQNNVALNNTHPVPNNNSLDEARFRPLSKAYSDQTHQKALGGSQGSGLASWMEQARDYYNQVMSGEAERPSPEAWDEFLYQMDWASQQLYGASESYGPLGADDWSEDAEAPSVNNYGGEMGPEGNYNYDMVETHIGFTGDNTRNDIYGSDNSIDIDMPSAQVSTEISQDHGVSVLKVTVKTSKGTAVYYYDNYASPDFKLDINIPDVSKVTGLTGLPTDLQAKVHAKKYVPNQNPENTIPESSVPGTPVEGQDNTYYYEGTVGETIDFTPQGSGVKDEVTTHDVFGDANISVKTSDTVKVTTAAAGSDFDYVITVTHKDGSVDKFQIRKAFDTNINAVEEFVSWDVDGVDGLDTVEPGKVPTSLKDFLSLNKSGDVGEGSSAHPEDTVADSTDGNVANYTTSADVDLHADYEDDIGIHKISAPGTVVIHGADYSDTMEVTYDATTRTWTVIVSKGGDATNQEIFEIKGGANTKVILDTMAEVTGSSEAKATVQIGLDGTPGATGTDAKTQVIDQLVGLTGRSEEEVLREIMTVYPEFGRYDANHDGKINRDELGKIIEEGNFPPATPDQRFMRLLYDLDPELKDATDHFRGQQNTSYFNENEASDGEYARVRDRIVGLLSVMYPEANVSAVANSGDGSDDIMFNGVRYDVVNQDNFYHDNWNLLHMDA